MNKNYKEHANCNGHQNNLTSDRFESEEDQDKLISILKNYYPDAFKNEKN